MVHYPRCITYGGLKILILEDVTQIELMNLRELDPHFLEQPMSPVVRVRPDAEGWERAKKFVDVIASERSR